MSFALLLASSVLLAKVFTEKRLPESKIELITKAIGLIGKVIMTHLHVFDL